MDGMQIYEGQFEEGHKSGWGRHIYFNASYYEGHWSDDIYEGQGKLVLGSTGKYPNISWEFVKEGEYQLGSLKSANYDNYRNCYEKIVARQYLIQQNLEKLCGDNVDKIIEKVRVYLTGRGVHAITRLLLEFQIVVVDFEFDTKHVDKTSFKDTLNYFGKFNLTDYQMGILFTHFAINDDKSQVNYFEFVREICGPVEQKSKDAIDETLNKLSKFCE